MLKLKYNIFTSTSLMQALKSVNLIQRLAWLYAAVFLSIFLISHWPGLTDSNGLLLGLYAIDPIDDIFHLLSGLAAAFAALHSYKWSVNYFKYVGIPYGIDAFVGLFFSTQFLNGDVFTKPLGTMNFSVDNILNNLPHVALLVTMLWIGFGVSQKFKPQR